MFNYVRYKTNRSYGRGSVQDDYEFLWNNNTQEYDFICYRSDGTKIIASFGDLARLRQKMLGAEQDRRKNARPVQLEILEDYRRGEFVRERAVEQF